MLPEVPPSEQEVTAHEKAGCDRTLAVTPREAKPQVRTAVADWVRAERFDALALATAPRGTVGAETRGQASVLVWLELAAAE